MPGPDIKAFPVEGKWHINRKTQTLSVTFGGVRRTISRTFFSPRPSGYHGGFDLGMPTDTGLKSMVNGDIRNRRHDGSRGWGLWNIVKGNDGHDYLQAHMKSARKPGTKVCAGDGVGRSDNTGNSSGPHCHWEKWWKSGDRATRVDLYWELVWLTENKQGFDKHKNPYPTPSDRRDLQYGDVGYPVMWLQWALEKKRVDGVFGRGTLRRVKAFQKKNGLKVTGKVNLATFRKLKRVVR